MNAISMRRLGQYGRFGNSLHQYAALSAVAQETNCEFQSPPWIGEYVFDLPNHRVTAQLPVYQECYDSAENPLVPSPRELVGHDFYGYAQYHTSWWTPERRTVWKDAFTPSPGWQNRMLPAMANFYGRGEERVGIHIRRGDYGQGGVYDAITPVEWYLAWLKKHWHALDNPVLFVASEDATLIEAFAGYHPETVETLGIGLQTIPYPYYSYLRQDLSSGKPHLIDFLPEWLMLRECDYLVMANSTFSFTAALCSTQAVRMFRPCIAESRFIEEDVWNCWPLRKDCPKKRK